MRRVSIPGVLAGGFVDVVTSVVLGIPFSVIAVMHVDFAHTPKDQLQHAIQAAMHSNAILYVAQLLVGAACSVLGGYIAALIAKRHETLNGFLSCWLCVAGGIWMIAARISDEPLARQILLLLISPALAWLGGYLRSRQVRQNLTARVAPVR